MELPSIKIPQIELPFDIPLLMHPPVDHFIIALPIIILFLEFINLFAKKRAIGVVSFLLIILTVIAAVAAYLTGSVDGKEAYPLLNEVAQGELKEHKLLGTWLMVASAVVLVFKLLSAMIGRGIMKVLYLAVLILFVAGILKQGKEGGELVYKYGANVEAVQKLDSELFDAKEELEELQEELKEETKAPEAKVVPAATTTESKEAPAEIALESATTEVKETPSETPAATETPESVKAEVVESVEVVEEKVEAVEVVTETKEVSAVSAATETTSSPTETVVESVKAEVVEVAEEKVEEVKVEVVPQAVETPQIATH